MIDIKLPVSWLREKGVELAIGDKLSHNDGRHCVWDQFDVDNHKKGSRWIGLSITSFAWRVGGYFDAVNLPIEVVSRPLNSATKWKPDAKALMEMYTAEKSDSNGKYTKMFDAARDENLSYAKKLFSSIEASGRYDNPRKASVNLGPNTESNHSMPIDKPMITTVCGHSDNTRKEENEPYNYGILLKNWTVAGPKSEAEKVTFCSRMEMSRPPIPSECGSFMVNFCGHSDNITPPETKKETKLKLTKDDIGKKFLYLGENAKVCNISDSAERFVLSTSTDGFIVVNKNGESCTSDTFKLEQCEPRYWLKDLPDADLFKYDWFACDENGVWCNFDLKPEKNRWSFDTKENNDCYEIMGCIKDLPVLKDGEWEESCVNLREWQKENKDSNQIDTQKRRTVFIDKSNVPSFNGPAEIKQGDLVSLRTSFIVVDVIGEWIEVTPSPSDDKEMNND